MHLCCMRSRVHFSRGYIPRLPAAVVVRRGCLPHAGDGGVWPLPGVSLPAQAPFSAARYRRPCSGGDCERASAGLRSAGTAARTDRLCYCVDEHAKSALAHRIQSTLLEEKCQARPTTIRPAKDKKATGRWRRTCGRDMATDRCRPHRAGSTGATHTAAAANRKR